jgi:LexA-binding, inner membrane-associated putative hydrolase
MFIGHLPAGFITAKLLFLRFEASSVSYKNFLVWGMLGAIAPDIDLLYFYLIDHRQHLHHSYFTHFPLSWFSLLILSTAWFYFAMPRKNAALAIIFSLGGFIHLFLDTTVGGIQWFAPFVNKPFSLATVPAIYKPWWLNFLLHWSFGIEIMVVCWAIYLWRTNIGGCVFNLLFNFSNGFTKFISLTNNPITVSCISSVLEKQIVFLVKRFIRVRNIKCLRSIF